MNIRMMIAAFFALGITLATDVSYAASAAENAPPAAAQQAPLLRNPALVETNHGEGLGPNGVDLHYGDAMESATDDAQLLLQSLQEPMLLQLQVPSLQPAAGEQAAAEEQAHNMNRGEVSAAP